MGKSLKQADIPVGLKKKGETCSGCSLCVIPLISPLSDLLGGKDNSSVSCFAYMGDLLRHPRVFLALEQSGALEQDEHNSSMEETSGTHRAGHSAQRGSPCRAAKARRGWTAGL